MSSFMLWKMFNLVFYISNYFFRIFEISLENAVFKSKFPVHGKSRKLSTIGGNDNIAIDAENNKKVTIQHCKDMKKCACR